MLPVVLGLLALCIGPILGPVLKRFPALASVFDGFVVVAVCGLVVLHVIPQSVALGGNIALLVAAVGVAIPALLHRLDARQQSRAVKGSRDVVTTLLLVGAAFAHALLDGTALIGGDAGHAVEGAVHAGHAGHDDSGASFSVLAVAVLLHRIPYGLALWTVGRERLGLPRTLLVLGALAAGTIAGAVGGQHLVTTSTAAGFALVQAFAAGAILHVLLDAPPVDVSGHPRSSLVGVVAGVLVLALLAQSHPFLATVERELAFGPTLVALAAACAPPLVVAFLVSALVGSRKRLRLPLATDGPRIAQAAVGVVAGALRSLCTCTVVPLFEGLVRRRASVAAATAFLVAAPEVSAQGLLLSGELLGLPFTLVRLGAALLLALIAGVVVAACAPAADDDAGASANAASGAPADRAADSKADGAADTHLGPTFWQALQRAFDHVAPWMVAGLLVAAFLEPLLAPDVLSSIPRVIEVPLYAVVGMPLYLCGSGAAPIAAALLHKGASAGAVTALLLAAPATNLATLGLLSRLLSRRAAAAFFVCVFVVANAAGFVVNAAAPALSIPSLHQRAGSAPSFVELGCLALLLVLLAFSVARQGARGFLGQILHPLDDAKGGHVHGPHCGHAEHRRPGFLKKAPVATVRIDFKP